MLKKVLKRSFKIPLKKEKVLIIKLAISGHIRMIGRDILTQCAAKLFRLPAFCAREEII